MKTNAFMLEAFVSLFVLFILTGLVSVFQFHLELPIDLQFVWLVAGSSRHS